MPLDASTLPLYVAAIAALVTLMAAGITSLNAREIERAKAHRQYVTKVTEPALEAFDQWHREFWGHVLRGSREEMHEFLTDGRNPHLGREELVGFRHVVKLRWSTVRKYRKFIKAQDWYRRRLLEDLKRTREDRKAVDAEPRLAMLRAEVELLAGVTRGYIDYSLAWEAFRRALIKDIFR